MPSNAELAKRIEQLEAASAPNLDDLVEILFEKLKSKMQSSEPAEGAVQAELAELVSSVEMLNGIVEQTKAENARLVEANKALQARNEGLSKRVSELEQYSRLNNVELRGIPCTQGEQCDEIVKKVGSTIGCSVADSDIDVAHRVPTKSPQNQNIIIRFCSRAKKQDFIAKARKAKLNTKDLGFAGAQNYPVFVNEHLTPDNKRLFAKALALKKEKGWQFLWTSNCHIKARQTENGRVFRIASDRDLAVFG